MTALTAYRLRFKHATEAVMEVPTAIVFHEDVLFGAWLMANDLGAELTSDDSVTEWRRRVNEMLAERKAA